MCQFHCYSSFKAKRGFCRTIINYRWQLLLRTSLQIRIHEYLQIDYQREVEVEMHPFCCYYYYYCE